MAASRGNNTVNSAARSTAQDVRNLQKSSNAKIAAVGNAVVATNVSVAQIQADMADSFTTTNLTVTNQIVGTSGNKPLYGWSGDGDYPLDITTATAEDCAALINYVYAVLVDTGILAS